MTSILEAILIGYGFLIGLKLLMRCKGDLRIAGVILVFGFLPALLLRRHAPGFLGERTIGIGEGAGRVDFPIADLLAAVLGVLVIVHLLVALLGWLRWRSRNEYILSLHRGLLKLGLILLLLPITLKIVKPELEFGSLLASATIGSIILGLALQETLGNLFAGLSLEAENLYRKGEFIRVGDGGPRGMVIEKTWRSTRIITLDGEMIIVPNNKIAGEIIWNYDRPTTRVGLRIQVGTSYDDAPMLVKETLRAVIAQDPDVLAESPIDVWTKEYADFSVNYEARFWIDGFRRHNTIKDRIMTGIWYAFRERGITIPFPIQTEQQIDYTELQRIAQERSDRVRGIVDALREVEVLRRHLSDVDLTFVAENARPVRFAPGALIVGKGERSEHIYFVLQGHARVRLPSGEEKTIDPRGYFGEIGAVRGVPRTVDVHAGPDGGEFLAVGREALLSLVRQRPGLRGELDQTGGQRLVELEGEPAPAAAARKARVTMKRMMQATLRSLLPW